MRETRLCPVCNVRLPGDAPHGLCPACLLAQALEPEHTPHDVAGTDRSISRDKISPTPQKDFDAGL
jgi:hypothetical protein